MPHASEGYLDGGQCAVLTEVLRRHTAEPGRCTFLYASAHGSVLPDVAKPFAARLRLADHLGTEADIGTACRHPVAPTIWWPLDRSWIVVTPYDCQSTYVGCSREAEQAVVAAGLEVLPASLRDEIS
jgi:hypothetical protein